MKEENSIEEQALEELVVENQDAPVTDLIEEQEENTEVEVVEAVEEEQAEAESIVLDSNMSRSELTESFINEARVLVSGAEGKVDECKLLLSTDLKSYDEAKTALKEGGMEESDVLLSALGYREDAEDEETLEEEKVVFEAKDEVAPLYIQDVSSGKFSSFLLSLIVGAGALAGSAYYAATQMGMTLDFTKVPSPEILTKVFGWFGTQIGRPDDALNGGAAVGVVLFLIMLIIYKMRVGGKSKKNLSFATNQLEEAKAHALHKEDCKVQMEKVDAHIQESIETLKTYQVLFTEQKGKLQRILHIEGEKEYASEYHAKSQEIMQDTAELLHAVKSFMSVPMSEEGKLSGKSTLFLHSAKAKIQKVIERLY